MQSGAMVNEAMMDQLKASDTWNEYQASRLKHHLYTIAGNSLVDGGAAPAPHTGGAETAGKPAPAAKEGRAAHGGAPAEAKKPKKEEPGFKALPSDKRLAKYADQVTKESEKEEKLSEDAKKREEESAHKMHKHHQFAISVAFIQVAVALSAIAALTRIKPVWWLSMGIGLVGMVSFFIGLAP